MDLSGLRKFVAPEIVAGSGARHLVGNYALALGVSHPLIVSDQNVWKLRWVADVIGHLDETETRHSHFIDVSPNPRSNEVMEGAERFAEAGCDSIIAVGGGSVLDAAKGIGIVVANGGDILDYEGADRVERAIPPLICLPTTCGSAADVSQFAIINDVIRRVKIAIISKAIVPDLSLIDPDTLTTLDPYVMACTVIDTLSHAVEAYASNASSGITDLHAQKAIQLVSANLQAALADREDSVIRQELMNACLYAGLAFSNASLGCVHALAHSLGGYLDLPHGECNALLLAGVIRFNYDICPSRYDEIGRCLGVCVDDIAPEKRCETIIEKVQSLRTAAGIAGSLKERGLSMSQIPLIAEKALADPCNATNPRPPSMSGLETILEQSL